MPRIDPLSLLKCLSVLLGPTGGIKSKDEVHRLANLMTKFSKKLVSKCIYIQILKTTNSELLSQFMSAGGWNLIHMWLSDGILTKNWALVQELLELLLLCPVDIERLKSNNCPKLIKGLSKEAKDLTVRASASKLVDQWLKIVKGEVAPNSIPQQQQQQIEPLTTTTTTTINNCSIQSQEDIMINQSLNDDMNIDESTIETNELNLPNNCEEQYQDNNKLNNINVQPVQLQIVNKTFPGQSQPTQISKQSFVVVNPGQNQQSTGSVYKIIIKDGKNVLSKVETDQKNIKNNLYKTNDCVNNIDSNIKNDDDDGTNNINDENIIINNCDDDVDNVNGIVDKCQVVNNIDCNNIDVNNTIDDNNKDNIISSSDVNKSSDKENRDSRKKDDKSTDKKSSSHHSSSSSSSSSSKNKHSSSSSSRSSSSSHRSSSHRSSSSSSKSSSSKSSKDRDKHHSSSSKHSSSSSSSRSSKSDKDKEKLKKDQAEKDKATLEKVQGQSLSTKFGKIPKKKTDDDKNDTTTTTTLRKSSTDSRDSSKENKDNKKSSSTSLLEKKNISMSIENRKNSTDSTRPKTVKTFNSKFRSTGLEEEVKPPPSRSAAASAKKSSTNQINDKKSVPPKISLKRPSPLRETPIIDKKAKLSLEPPATIGNEEKKGAIKLIAPKPKPMVLQESDMFMDALMTASTKSKEPRKRKRKTSLTKDDTKKSDDQGGKDGGSSPPSSSPQTADERSPLPIKPDFKFYQDTLETDEDKEEKEKSQDDEEAQEDNEKNRTNSDDDDERSQTPTCDDNSQDEKDNQDDSFGTQHNPLSPNSEIRCIDGLRSVLVIQKRKGPKKSLKWKTDLESIRYFELDETERVNVTKTFTDMKQIEKQNERQAFQMARKLSTEDTMEEKTQWRLLIKIDLPPALVDPGKDSKERDIQYAREKGILQALYFNHGMIPDSPAEPDEERHHIISDPITIPLDDLTGNKESEKDFSMMTWPEAKSSSLSSTPPIISAPINLPPTIQSHQQSILPQNIHYPQFNQHNQILPIMQNGPMGITQLPPGILPMNTINEINTNTGGGGGGWRTGDGKVVVPDVNMTGGGGMSGFPPSVMDPSLIPQGMIPPPGLYSQSADNFTGILGNDDNNFGHMQNNFQGPGGIFNNFRGGSGGQLMANRGRGGPGWFRGAPGPVGPPVPMRGAWNGGGGGGGGGGRGGNWGRGNGKQICRQFTKNGYCRVGDKCQYLHPGVNCPPF